MSQPWPSALSRLAASNLAAQSAEQVSLAAAPLIVVLALGGGPGATGLLAAAQTLPFLLASLPLGWLADRLPRARLMAAAEGLRALALAALLLAWSTQSLSLGLLAALGFLGALGTVAYTVATPGLVATLAPRTLLARANARLELARAAAFAAGPAVAGYLVAGLGVAAAIVAALLLSVAALGLLPRRAEPSRRPAAVAPTPWHAIGAGVAFVRTDPWLRPILATAVVFNIAWFVLMGVYVSYAARVMGLSATWIGLTLALSGVGMLAGAACAPRLMRALPFGRVLVLGPVAATLAAACMALTWVWPSPWLAGLAFLLLGAGPMVWTVATTTLRQHITPAAMLGRVSAVFLTANAGARPVGAALGALVGMLAGEPVCLLVALAGFVMQMAIIVRSAPAALRAMPAHASEPS
ncbi:MAG: hypothetical protein GAK30_02897 [Paracidovorax wautersii]|uniref:Major facilitator superfamily (MFS) profile domain-containing protein n=1 Tax=Paracidovorax wautersii TaxID=1177982 RepID=A0A7V8FM12_9BURK|nr:MAG: hypothetical protein GAK30_02897 [Paracidovorax wautersii]